MFMEPSMRWYGPNDRVPLSFIRQSGAEGVVTSLHHIPYGEVWSRGEIEKRSAEADAAGLFWNVVESLPVHEDVKLRSGDFLRHIENYRESLRNLGACGIRTVVYNFMPVLDWIRTDLRYRLPDGCERCISTGLIARSSCYFKRDGRRRIIRRRWSRRRKNTLPDCRRPAAKRCAATSSTIFPDSRALRLTRCAACWRVTPASVPRNCVRISVCFWKRWFRLRRRPG